MFDQFITYQAKQRAGSLAVINAHRRVNFATFDSDIDKIAGALRELSPNAGKPVGVVIEDPYHHWLTILALARCGIASTQGSDETCMACISDEADEGHSRTLKMPPDWFEARLLGPAAATGSTVDLSPGGLARIMRTSGTTGETKRMPYTWAGVDAIIRNTPIAYGAAQDQRWLTLLGPSTILGFALTLGGWATGNAAVLLDDKRFDGTTLTAFEPNLIGMVPHQLRDLLVALPQHFGIAHPLRIVTGGSPLPATLAQDASRKLTPDIRSVYGASECSAVAIADVALIAARRGAAGYVLPGVRVEILAPDGSPQPRGDSGEVRIRSNRVIQGYIDDPVRTATTFRNGWFHPGDMGRLESDGLLVIEGRIDDMMNLGGDKVMPSVIENAVAGDPAIVDVAAFSVPDESGLDRCWLAIVPGVGFSSDTVDRHVRTRLPWLGHLIWVTLDAIPRNAMGKVQRDRLRAAALATVARRKAAP